VRLLADTSFVVRLLRDDPDVSRWTGPVRAGRVGICAPVEVELRRTVRSQRHDDELAALLRELFVWHPVPERAWIFVERTQRELVRIGHHRGPSLADLLVSATAATWGLTILHVDEDFPAIARVADLQAERADRPGPTPP
jgi:hypothetical protein